VAWLFSLERFAGRVVTIAGDFGHSSGILAGIAAMIFAFGGVAFTGGMGAFLRFGGHFGLVSGLGESTLMAM
jgi:hypothetical protein